MAKYEHRVVGEPNIPTITATQNRYDPDYVARYLENHLNTLGEDGWKLLMPYPLPSNGGSVLIFQREVDEEDRKNKDAERIAKEQQEELNREHEKGVPEEQVHIAQPSEQEQHEGAPNDVS
jgi:hypothetical protein